MKRILLFIYLISLFTSCNSKPKGIFNNPNASLPIDYSKSENWAALPDKADQADRTPHSDLVDLQKEAKVDVFFLHPTTYTRKRGNTNWNAKIDDTELNQTTDDGTILNQASVFNGVGKVYAPRYRQAHIQAYFSKDTVSSQRAFEFAYKDVKTAFEYYLKHYNNGRPIILASHSQGTNHAEMLLKELFDGKPLQDKLVAAYLVGMPIEQDAFQNIKVCKTPEEVSCFCSWRTFKHGNFPKKDYQLNNTIAVTNPLTWTTDETYAPAMLNQGTVLYDFEKHFTKQLVDAQVKDGVLWVHKPKFRGSIFLITKNYHIADYNLFYVNVRKNAMLRANTFLEK